MMQQEYYWPGPLHRVERGPFTPASHPGEGWHHQPLTPAAPAREDSDDTPTARMPALSPEASVRSLERVQGIHLRAVLRMADIDAALIQDDLDVDGTSDVAASARRPATHARGPR